MTIPGLDYLEHFITPDEEAMLLEAIDQEPWRNDLKRRVQHYGYRYDYTSRRVDAADHIGSLPAWATFLSERLLAGGHFATVPDQLIVNEYESGQGIASHIDCQPCFGDVVSSLTLGSHCVMEMTSAAQGEVIPLLLERRSMLVLSGDARHFWKHGIPKRKTDLVGETRRPRGRRVSLTFRTVILGR